MQPMTACTCLLKADDFLGIPVSAQQAMVREERKRCPVCRHGTAEGVVSMAKALIAGRFMAIEADDKSFWSIRRYDHYLTEEEARGIPTGEWEQVGMAYDKESAKAGIAHQIELENNTP